MKIWRIFSCFVPRNKLALKAAKNIFAQAISFPDIKDSNITRIIYFKKNLEANTKDQNM